MTMLSKRWVAEYPEDPEALEGSKGRSHPHVRVRTGVSLHYARAFPVRAHFL